MVGPPARGWEVLQVILVSRVNGTDLWLNPMLVESVERTHDSIVTLTNGHKYILRDTPEEITEKTMAFYRRIGLVGEAGNMGGTE